MLDARTGCTWWSFDAGGVKRTAIVIGDWPGKAGRHLAYFTTIPGWLYALDAATGAQVWKARVEDHLSTRLTGSTVVYGGRLYVPAASFEEGMSANGTYACCSFRGSLSAFGAATGARLWKSIRTQIPIHDPARLVCQCLLDCCPFVFRPRCKPRLPKKLAQFDDRQTNEFAKPACGS